MTYFHDEPQPTEPARENAALTATQVEAWAQIAEGCGDTATANRFHLCGLEIARLRSALHLDENTALTYRPIPAEQCVVGDMLANQATITEVTIGPVSEAEYEDKWLRPVAGDTTIRCGDGFGWRVKGDRLVVIGRRTWPS